MNFVTLKELKKMVPAVEEGKRPPSLKKILEEGTEVVLRKLMENHAEVVVYKNGYVLYQAHERSTVFPIHDCKHYHYESQGHEQQTIPHDHFEDMEWHIRLVIEGEDRLAHNTSSRESEVFSYSEDNDYNARLVDPRMNVSDMVVNKVLLRSMQPKRKWLTGRVSLRTMQAALQSARRTMCGNPLCWHSFMQSRQSAVQNRRNP